MLTYGSQTAILLMLMLIVAVMVMTKCREATTSRAGVGGVRCDSVSREVLHLVFVRKGECPRLFFPHLVLVLVPHLLEQVLPHPGRLMHEAQIELGHEHWLLSSSRQLVVHAADEDHHIVLVRNDFIRCGPKEAFPIRPTPTHRCRRHPLRNSVFPPAPALLPQRMRMRSPRVRCIAFNGRLAPQ